MTENTQNKVSKAYLVLEDGTVYEGYSMGKSAKAIGEVVFNTNCSTYQDLLSDPTYSGQIVVQTYPLIGNRGCLLYTSNQYPTEEHRNIMIYPTLGKRTT